jgi:hypothetical protein
MKLEIDPKITKLINIRIKTEVRKYTMGKLLNISFRISALYCILRIYIFILEEISYWKAHAFYVGFFGPPPYTSDNGNPLPSLLVFQSV